MSGTKAAPGTLTPQPPPGKQRRPRGGPRRSRGGRRSALLLNLAALVLGVCVWAVLAWLDVQGLPGPAAVLAEAGELAGDGTLAEDILASVRRVLTGFALGSLAAVAAGFLMGWYPLARGLLEP